MLGRARISLEKASGREESAPVKAFIYAAGRGLRLGPEHSVQPKILLKLGGRTLHRSYSTADDDPVLVPVRDGRPFEFRKRWRGECDLVGESVGYFKVDPAELDYPEDVQFASRNVLPLIDGA
jgi:hypothetical protein